jgi:hypothetical protein
MKPEDLICYCGVYGASCARWQGYEPFRKGAELLGKWVDAQGFQHWMPGAMRNFDFNEFRKGLEFFASDSTWLVCHECCIGGEGFTECDIRKCCVERGVDICFECSDFPCPKAQRPGMLERAKEYERLGRAKWLEREIERAEKGYELHLGKYVSIHVEDTPPE